MADESAVQVESKAATLIEPDLNFVRELKEAGGDTLKKCFQCATCSVVCALSPDQKPYPRKEMVYSQWGLKDKLVNNVDVWLCHYCNDCSTHCPRGARPGDTLRAVRALSFRHFAFPSFMGKIVGEKKYLPIMLAIPVLILLLGIKIAGGHIPEGAVEYRDLFPLLLVDAIFVTVTFLAIGSIGFGLWNFLQGIHANAVAEGYAEDKPLAMGDYVKSLISVIPTILLHDKFKLCTTNRDRYWAHILVLVGFVGLFIVTNLGFVGIYGGPLLGINTDFLAPPYSIANPIKLFALLVGIGLLGGILLVIANRLKPKDAESTISYLDWSLIVAVLVTVSTGLLTWIGRVGNLGTVAYGIYFLHLGSVFYIIAYLPYSKLAHMFYRTVAMGYAAYIDRPFGVEGVAAAPVAAPEVEPTPAAEEPAAEAEPVEEKAEAPAEVEAEAPAEPEEEKPAEEEEKKE
ncbi:MAG: quinone-interacting membrane-bound oxidoreductase complex subunit QmoC [Deltaproteobacteria bacterium]|nr:quinone-interacting membrane-bound oxidoreductase complex subunit QmoC [Deltaproteobacteria bacterium]